MEHGQEHGQRARLHLGGVQTPIVTQITRQTERGMTVEQALPFLRLQTEVWDDARQRARIESVSMVVYDGMPRLVLDLAFDGREGREPAALPAHAGVVRSRARLDETVPFELPRPLPREVAGLALSPMERELLQPRDLPYRVRVAWARARPVLVRAALATERLARTVVWPLCARVSRSLLARSRAGLRRLSRARSKPRA